MQNINAIASVWFLSFWKFYEYVLYVLYCVQIISKKFEFYITVWKLVGSLILGAKFTYLSLEFSSSLDLSTPCIENCWKTRIFLTLATESVG